MIDRTVLHAKEEVVAMAYKNINQLEALLSSKCRASREDR